MPNELETLRIAVVLARDVEEAREDLCEVEREVNLIAEQENRAVRVQFVKWYEEDQSAFYRESPHTLFEQIVKEEQPDIIIGVFWHAFGSTKLADDWNPGQEWPHIIAGWQDPRVLIYHCNKTPRLPNEAAKAQYQSLRDFRAAVPLGKFWWFYKPKSKASKKRRAEELFSLVTGHLLEIVRGWRSGSSPSEVDLNPPPELEWPEGWEYLSLQDLEDARAALNEDDRLTDSEAADFFNGSKKPHWKEGISTSIHRRIYVREIQKIIKAAAQESRPAITLLKGPGGEGKSTILRQVAVDLTDSRSGIHVIWHEQTYTPLESTFVSQLLEQQGKFVIVSDDAELIAKNIDESLGHLYGRPTCNVQFLLASRTMDWNGIGARGFENSWRVKLGPTNFHLFEIKTIHPEDAKPIVETWEQANALEDFAQVPADERPALLLKIAEEEGRLRPAEGSFFGAMLKTRKRDSFFEYYNGILGKLADEEHALAGEHHPAFKTLRDVVAGIAVLQADIAQPILYRPILLHALSYDEDQFGNFVAEKLEGEISATSYLITMRHRSIAELAATILRRQMPDALEKRILPRLIAASRDAYLGHEIFKPEATAWNNLPLSYFEQKRERLAIRLAIALADREPYDPFPVTKLAKLYRDWAKRTDDTSLLEEAANSFKSRYPEIKLENKGFYYEWSLAEGLRDNHCLSTVLSGYALTDSVKPRPEDNTWLTMLLTGLTSSFGELYKKCSDQFNLAFYDETAADVFGKAVAAAAQFGLDSLSLLEQTSQMKGEYDFLKSKRNLEYGHSLASSKGYTNVDPGEAFESLRTGIKLAWNLRTKDQDSLPKVFLDRFNLDNFSTVIKWFNVPIDSTQSRRGTYNSTPLIRRLNDE